MKRIECRVAPHRQAVERHAAERHHIDSSATRDKSDKAGGEAAAMRAPDRGARASMIRLP